MISRYRLTSAALAKYSKNAYIQAAAKENFVFSGGDTTTLNDPHGQLAADIERDWTLNYTNFATHLKELNSSHNKKQLIDFITDNLFSQKIKKQLLDHHCQRPAYLLGGNVIIANNDGHFPFTLGPKPDDHFSYIYHHANQAFLYNQCIAYKLKYSCTDESYEHDLTLMSLAKDEKVSNIDKTILQQAQRTHTPILIKATNNEYYIYGNKKGDGKWDFTAIDAKGVDLSKLPFDQKLIKRDHLLFNPILIKQGHVLADEVSYYFAHHNATNLCVLTDHGYQLLEQNTDSMIIYDLWMGAKPQDAEWFHQRDKNKWSWSEKNLRIFEPVFTDSYIAPLSYRIKNLFHTIFNADNPHKSDLAGFFDWPDNNTSTLAKLGRYLLAGRFLSVIKNSAKLITEFLPGCIEEASTYLLEQSKKYLSNPRNSTFSLSTIGAAVGVALGALFYTVAKTTREITMRITSPIRSLQDAYEFGLKNKSKALGYVCASISALFSLAGLALLGFFTLPLIAAVVPSIAIEAGIKAGIPLAITSTIDRFWAPITARQQKNLTQSILAKTEKETIKLKRVETALAKKEAKQQEPGVLNSIQRLLGISTTTAPQTQTPLQYTDSSAEMKETSPPKPLCESFADKATQLTAFIRVSSSNPAKTTSHKASR